MEIDALTGECFFEGEPIDPLPVAGVLQGWLRDDLRSQKIAIENLKVARLRASLVFGLVPWSKRQKHTEVFYRDSKAIQTEQVHRCEIQCESEIATDEALYRSRLEDLQEWPIEWPQADSTPYLPALAAPH